MKQSTRSFKMSSIPVKKIFNRKADKKYNVIQHPHWSKDEDRALIEFIGCAQIDDNYGWDSTVTEWPAFVSCNKLWGDAAKHIKEATKSTFLLTNKNVRSRIHRYLKKKFENLDAAEDALSDTDDVNSLVSKKQQNVDMMKAVGTTPLKKRVIKKDLQTSGNSKDASVSVSLPPMLDDLKKMVVELSDDDKLSITEFLFSSLSPQPGIDHCLWFGIPGFIKLTLEALWTLKRFRKPNLLHKLAHSLATKRPSSDDPLFVPTRMPFGLVQYQIEFYSCKHTHEIKVPDDYQQWYEFMASEFTKAKFDRLFRGPMWNGKPHEDIGNPLKAQVNVAAPSGRTVRRHKQLKNEEACKEKNQADEVATTEKELTYHIFLPPKRNRVKKIKDPDAQKQTKAGKRKSSINNTKAVEAKKQKPEDTFIIIDGICSACGSSYSSRDTNEDLICCGVKDDQGNVIDGCGGWFHLSCTDLININLTTKELQTVKWHCQACTAVACILSDINL